MNAHGFAIVNDNGDVIDVARSQTKADRMADQIGATVRPIEFGVDSRVRFTFHGHPRVGHVTDGEGARIWVRFAQGGGEVIRSMSVEKVMPA